MRLVHSILGFGSSPSVGRCVIQRPLMSRKSHCELGKRNKSGILNHQNRPLNTLESASFQKQSGPIQWVQQPVWKRHLLYLQHPVLC
jgi:hypothetical protein